MPNLLDRLRNGPTTSERSAWPATLTIDDYLSYFTYAGQQYPLGVTSTMSGSQPVEIGNSYEAYIAGIAKTNGIVAAAVRARSLLMSQLRFQWRSLNDQDRGRLFGTRDLAPLEGSARPELLQRAEVHVCYAGNAYFYRPPSGPVRLMRPDWVKVLIESDQTPDSGSWALDARVVGYVYDPPGRGAPQLLVPDEVAHWKPEPDPTNDWRGESWVTSVLREVVLDGQATDHLGKFFENAATPNLVFSLDPSVTQEQAEAYAALMREHHSGVENAYKPLMVGGGADVTIAGAKVSDLAYKELSGGFEARIASRARVPAVVLGIREGMQGSALNSGNYSQTRRLWADGWFTPHAETLCATLGPLLDQPSGGPSELAHDPSRVLFLQDDRKDEADINQVQAIALRQLVEGGFDPTSAVEAVTTNDYSKLRHTGRLSVQLHTADETAPAPEETPQ